MEGNIAKRESVTVFLVKFVLLVILKEKDQLKQRKLKMKILGIGNAIVDVICKVDESFINQNKLSKGTMKLIFDDKEFKSMLSNLFHPLPRPLPLKSTNLDLPDLSVARKKVEKRLATNGISKPNF